MINIHSQSLCHGKFRPLAFHLKNFGHPYASVCVCVLVAYPLGTVHVVSEGEEGVGAEGHRLQRAQPVLPLSLGQQLRNLLKHVLPRCQVWALCHTVTI